ncbi:hypothetical protein D9758_004749 [Tetrapyrgos nigripes]|uniref:CCD97-like C-terminal domain-containing protein n=1 Tax=Tetrapyrgos nigripes TaxID=182062 RepID=A0A8H5G688_9AGAR|nr:hypothetical protein D9758_004749 [Tetrapyrgos nigripes]
MVDSVLSMDAGVILKYLDLPVDYRPSPADKPVEFLTKHLNQLPPHLSSKFSAVLTPKQRTMVPAIRNRRLEYLKSNPTDLSFTHARHEWPNLWQGRERPGIEEGDEERQWANNNFLEGFDKHVKKLGTLLGGYEEEREAERVRNVRRQQRAVQEDEFVPEEDDSDSDEELPDQIETEAELKEAFERRIRELFIYGMLEGYDYDKVDWDEGLDVDNDRELEEKWFEEEDEE